MLVGFRGKCPFRLYIYLVSLSNIESKFMHCVMLKFFIYRTWKFMPERCLKGHIKIIQTDTFEQM